MNEKNGRGTLVAVGGGESGEVTKDSLKIIERFIELAGGAEKAHIVLMTVATNNPEKAEERYEKIFQELNLASFETLDITDRRESFDEETLKTVERADALYFTGGAQLHVTALTGGTPLHRLILEKFEAGMTIGGTSAGAMMMSSATLVSGTADCAPRLDSVEVAPGMNLLDNSIIDTHFSQRGRHGRLLSAVVHNPQTLGFGIDERTAMVVNDGFFEVLGEGSVTVVDVGQSRHTNLPYIKHHQAIGVCNVHLHVLPEGYKFDLEKREPITPTAEKIMAAANEE